jgi:hypothetical protein
MDRNEQMVEEEKKKLGIVILGTKMLIFIYC